MNKSANDHILLNCPLHNSVSAVVRDATHHYFGGYYHVRVVVTANIPLIETYFNTDVEMTEACKVLGDKVVFTRTLEKMAVPEAEIDSVRQHLLDSFIENVLPYLQKTDFPARFVMSEYRGYLMSGRRGYGNQYA